MIFSFFSVPFLSLCCNYVNGSLHFDFIWTRRTSGKPSDAITKRETRKIKLWSSTLNEISCQWMSVAIRVEQFFFSFFCLSSYVITLAEAKILIEETWWLQYTACLHMYMPYEISADSQWVIPVRYSEPVRYTNFYGENGKN